MTNWLDDERGKEIYINGVPVPNRKELDLTGLLITSTDSDERTTIDFGHQDTLQGDSDTYITNKLNTGTATRASVAASGATTYDITIPDGYLYRITYLITVQGAGPIGSAGDYFVSATATGGAVTVQQEIELVVPLTDLDLTVATSNPSSNVLRLTITNTNAGAQTIGVTYSAIFEDVSWTV